MEKKNNGKTIALIVLGVLTAFGLVIAIVSGIRYSAYFTSGAYYTLVAYAVMSVLLLYYAVAGYKIPHGNLLKYLFLVFAACCLFSIVSVVTEHTPADTAYNALRGIAVLLAAYVAGRLDRFKQNVIIMSVIGVLVLSSCIVLAAPFVDAFFSIACFIYFILWVNLMFAYILRYKEHKEAGLTDK